MIPLKDELLTAGVILILLVAIGITAVKVLGGSDEEMDSELEDIVERNRR